MANSTRYNDLESRISQIEGHLLPAISVTGVYSVKEDDLTRAYCVLCHAEIEAYLEDILRETTKKVYDRWMLNKDIIHPILLHLAFTYKLKEKAKDNPASTIAKSYISYGKVIDGNNGVKDHNLTNLLVPIGFNIDGPLRATLEDFGKRRGEIAHASFKTHSVLDPATERSRIKLIVDGLKEFDDGLISYEISGIVNRMPAYMYGRKLSLLQRLSFLFGYRL